jgi:hypothetical protein
VPTFSAHPTESNPLKQEETKKKITKSLTKKQLFGKKKHAACVWKTRLQAENVFFFAPFDGTFYLLFSNDENAK